jgi:hypothetical protein
MELEMLLLEQDGSITYKGKVVARRLLKDGRDLVEINLTYDVQCDDEWMVPLVHLATGLRAIEPPGPPVVLSVTTSENDIEERFDVPRFLIEKIIKRDGYIWNFHKSDTDTWP